MLDSGLRLLSCGCLQVQQATLGTELLSVQKIWQAQQQQMEQVSCQILSLNLLIQHGCFGNPCSPKECDPPPACALQQQPGHAFLWHSEMRGVTQLNCVLPRMHVACAGAAGAAAGEAAA